MTECWKFTAKHCLYLTSSNDLLSGETYLAPILAAAKERCWMANQAASQAFLWPVPERQINTQMKFSPCWRIHNSYTLRWSRIYYRSDGGNSSSIDRPEGVSFPSGKQPLWQIKRWACFRSRRRENTQLQKELETSLCARHLTPKHPTSWMWTCGCSIMHTHPVKFMGKYTYSAKYRVTIFYLNYKVSNGCFLVFTTSLTIFFSLFKCHQIKKRKLNLQAAMMGPSESCLQDMIDSFSSLSCDDLLIKGFA